MISYKLEFNYFGGIYSSREEIIFRFPTVEELRYHNLRNDECYCINVYKIIDGEEIRSEAENGLNRFYFKGEVISKDNLKYDLDGDPSIRIYGAVLYWKKMTFWFNPKMDKRI